jgi:hypothetical protein
MSILRDIINSISSAISNEAFEQVKAREMHDQILEAIHKTSKDHSITTDEIADVKALMTQLQISEIEMEHIKLEILQGLIDHVLKDNKISEGEMSLLKEVEDGLKVAETDKEKLAEDLEKVKKLFNQ